ncbi:CsbD family protein [Streptococcus cameli]
MSEEKLNAKLDQLSGSVKEGFGKLTGDKEIQAEGVVEKLSGKAKEGIENAKDTVKGIVDGLKNEANKDGEV